LFFTYQSTCMEHSKYTFKGDHLAGGKNQEDSVAVHHYESLQHRKTTFTTDCCLFMRGETSQFIYRVPKCGWPNVCACAAGIAVEGPSEWPSLGACCGGLSGFQDCTAGGCQWWHPELFQTDARTMVELCRY